MHRVEHLHSEGDAHTPAATKLVKYLALLQGDLALFLTADERPVTPEHSVSSPH